MAKNLIRNGGFERGTTDFWRSVNAKSFVVTDVNPRKGTYAGKLTSDGVNYAYITTNDYIKLVPGEVAYFEAYVRTSHVFTTKLYMEYYDEGLNFIDTIDYGLTGAGVGAYTQVLQAVTGVEGAIYCKPEIMSFAAVEDYYMLVDNVLMYKYSPEDVMGDEELLMQENSLDAAGTAYGNWSLVAPYKEAEFKLYVYQSLGTAESLLMTIESYGLGLTPVHTIATFNAVTASPNTQVLLVTAGVGSKIRAKRVLSGDPEEVSYELRGTYKR